MCNNTCTEQGFKFFQLAASVTGGEADHTVKLCKQCSPVKAARWRKLMDGAEAFPEKLWVVLGMEQYQRRMLGQEGIQGNWQKEPRFKQELQLVKRNSESSFLAS